MSEKVAARILLFGVVKSTGHVTSSSANSKAGERFSAYCLERLLSLLLMDSVLLFLGHHSVSLRPMLNTMLVPLGHCTMYAPKSYNLLQWSQPRCRSFQEKTRARINKGQLDNMDVCTDCFLCSAEQNCR
uniref:Uncharacterized protein n=1 Tax=Triticum urartu TaxID=4572 RepID=A0A8R7R713_TRIUA